MLEWEISPGGAKVVRVRLKGAITERASFDDLTLEGDRLVLVADGIRYINSTGLQKLWKFLEPLAARCTIEVERCSPALVMQLNLMPALADCLRVHSIIAPLECKECVAETDILLQVPSAGGMPAVPPRRCEVCGDAMVLSELEERYFSFLTDHA
jgi:hypothetical protein